MNFNEIEIFYKLYIDTMTKLEANKYYFFSKKWLYDLINLLKGKYSIISCLL